MTIQDYTHCGDGLPGPDLPVATSVEKLARTLIDGTIDEPQLQRLESLLATDARARQTYLDCVLMHVSLRERFESETQTSHMQERGT